MPKSRMTIFLPPSPEQPSTTSSPATRIGTGVNQVCLSLLDAPNAAAFRADAASYLARWPLDEDERAALLARDYSRLISMGANIYLLAKLGALDGDEGIVWELSFALARLAKSP